MSSIVNCECPFGRQIAATLGKGKRVRRQVNYAEEMKGVVSSRSGKPNRGEGEDDEYVPDKDGNYSDYAPSSGARPASGVAAVLYLFVLPCVWSCACFTPAPGAGYQSTGTVFLWWVFQASLSIAGVLRVHFQFCVA